MKLYHRVLVGLRNLAGKVSAWAYLAADKARDDADKAIVLAYDTELKLIALAEASLQVRKVDAEHALNSRLEDLNRVHYGR